MKKIEIEIPYGYEFDKETMSVVPVKDNMEYIDLGLPSGTLWASCNVGASKPEECGEYLNFTEAQKHSCPTKEQFKELIEYCSWIWCEVNDIKGYIVIGKNGQHIFLPAAGCVNDEIIENVGIGGHYWSSSGRNWDHIAWYLCFYSAYFGIYRNYYSRGYPVRPVKN